MSTDICDIVNGFCCEIRDNAPMNGTNHESLSQKEIRAWLRAKLDAAPHGTKGKLATFLGVSRESLSRMINDNPDKETRVIAAHEFMRAIEFFGDSPVGSDHIITAISSLPSQPPNAIMTPLAPERGAVIPLYGAEVGGRHGEFVLSGQRLAEVVGPASLAHVDGAYALRICGETMEPRYEANDIVFVNPLRRVGKGDYVAAQIRTNGSNKAVAYVGRFVRRNVDELVISQLNPAEEITFDNGAVIAVHYILRPGE